MAKHDRQHEARVREMYRRIKSAARHWDATALSYYEGRPFEALIAGMLSAQTREEATIAATRALFALADNPHDMLALSDRQIFEAIRPVSFSRSKAGYLRAICEQIVADGGEVPRTVEALTRLKGVGWKVAVLTLATGYGIYDDITVDVHVARIGKRIGLVKPETKQPPKINDELKRALPKALWPYWNGLMVQFGREVCKPTYPQCATCLVNDLCPRIGVVQTGPRTYKNAGYIKL